MIEEVYFIRGLEINGDYISRTIDVLRDREKAEQIKEGLKKYDNRYIKVNVSKEYCVKWLALYSTLVFFSW